MSFRPSFPSVLVLGAVLVLVVAGPGWPSVLAEQEPPSAQQVRRLVRQLGSPRLEQRQQAEQELIRLGPTVLPLLPRAESLPAEVANRLRRIRHQLQLRQAEQMVSGSRVTLQGEMTLAHALQVLQKQSGNRMLDYRERFGQQADNPRLKLDIGRRLFWQAVDQLCDQAGLTVYGYPEQPAVALVVRPPDVLPMKERIVHYHGAFRFEALSCFAVRQLQQREASHTSVKLQVAWEPKLQPVALELPWESVEARTDGGQALRLDRPGSLVVELVPGAPSEITLPLGEVPRAARRLEHLRGRLQVLLAGTREKFVFDPLMKSVGKSQRRASVVVTLHGVVPNNQTWQVMLLVQFEKTEGALESHRTWILDNPVHLIDPQNRKIPPDGMETFLHEEDKIGISYFFGLDHKPEKYKLEYETPVVILKQNVPWELKNIPLP